MPRWSPLLFALVAPLAAAADPPAAGKPTCALLDPARDPRAALLEAKALAADDATWVERAGIEKVLGEQKLQALFGPQGVGDRVRLGKLLKADLLVMVRPAAGAKEPALEVVVSETAGGLRLLVRGVPVTRDPDADAAALLAAVRDGIAKHRERVREVVAVPPFLSRDLGFDTDHLKGAYAKLAEQAALARPGVVAVELAEAEALGKELALGGPGARLDRPPPLYLLGEYRHEGRDKDRAVTLTLRAERAGQPAVPPVVRTVRPAEAPAAVRAWADARLDAAGRPVAPRPAADPRAEAQQIVARANAFRRLGDGGETLALAEAALLLDPTLTDMHAAAVQALTPVVRQAYLDATVRRPGGIDRLERAYTRGVDHLEPLIAAGALAGYRDRSGADLMLMFRGAANHMGGIHPDAGPEAVARYKAVREYERAAFLRLIPTLAARGKGEERWFVGQAVDGLPLPERFEQLGKLIDQLAAGPGARGRTVEYVRRGHVTPPDADTPQYKALVARLAASPNPDLRGAAADLASLVEKGKAAPPFGYSSIDPQDPAAPGPDGIKLRRVPLAVGPGGSSPAGRPVGLSGLIPAGPNTDVAWTRANLYVMRDKGTLRPVWRATGNDGLYGFSSVSHDGRFVWATLPRHQKAAVLLALDPTTGRVWDLSAADGLPQPPAAVGAASSDTPALMAAPLEPGRACVCGSVLGRTWVAVVTLDPAAGAGSARVIHEAREAQDRAAPDQWKGTGVSFTPNLMATLRAAPGPDGRPSRRVVIGRGEGENLKVRDHPLVVDPDRPGAEVLQDRVWAWPQQVRCATAAGAVYFVEPQLTPDRRHHLVRIGFPGSKKEVVAGGLAPADGQDARVAVHAGRVHVSLAQSATEVTDRSGVSTGRNTRHTRVDQWWVAGADGRNLRRVATGLRPLEWIADSSHYGLVASVGGELHTVEVPPATPKE